MQPSCIGLQAFLQNLDQCLNSGGSGSGLLGEGNRLDSNLNQSFEEHFGTHAASGNSRNSMHSPFSGKGFGFSGSPQQHLDILDQAARNHRSSAGSIIVGGPGRARYAG